MNTSISPAASVSGNSTAEIKPAMKILAATMIEAARVGRPSGLMTVRAT